MMIMYGSQGAKVHVVDDNADGDDKCNNGDDGDSGESGDKCKPDILESLTITLATWYV